MSDETLHKLGTYFVHFDVLKRYGLTFERFLQLVTIGQWGEVVGGTQTMEFSRKVVCGQVLRA